MGNMGMTVPDHDFWKGRRVLLTGHTGFKGGWLACWLNQLQVELYGYALPPWTDPNLYTCLKLPYAGEEIGDLRVPDQVSDFVKTARPEIVFHLAAQPLVRRSYRDPVETFTTNILGTVNLLQALRQVDSLKAVLVVTSDKAYDNCSDDKRRSSRLFQENDPLGGNDPYSASKAAQEIITRSFAQNFFRDPNIPVATARAGNVIGGGDWSEDRLMTDVLQAVSENVPIRLRAAKSTRPWQHVLEPLAGYLLYVEALVAGRVTERALNFGPCRSHQVMEVVDIILTHYPDNSGWVEETSPDPEAEALALDPARAMAALGWKTRLTLKEAVSMVVRWHKEHAADEDVLAATLGQIACYEEVLRKP